MPKMAKNDNIEFRNSETWSLMNIFFLTFSENVSSMAQAVAEILHFKVFKSGLTFSIPFFLTSVSEFCFPALCYVLLLHLHIVHIFFDSSVQRAVSEGGYVTN
jgi:hypothetical protein